MAQLDPFFGKHARIDTSQELTIFVIPFPGIKLGVGVDLVWAVNGSGYLGATISLTAGVDVVDAPFLDVEFSPVVGCYGICMFGDCPEGS